MLDLLRRVSVVIHQHILTCEKRLQQATPATEETGLFHVSQMRKFDQALFVVPQYVYAWAFCTASTSCRSPTARRRTRTSTTSCATCSSTGSCPPSAASSASSTSVSLVFVNRTCYASIQ